MMKMNKFLRSLFICVLILAVVLPGQAMAAGSIDLTHPPSLTIAYHDGETPLTGAQFQIYLVATVDEYGELTTTAPFSAYNVDIRGKDDAAWRTLASTLEGYVLRDAVTPTASGTTDEQGMLAFSGEDPVLPHGLYLILGQSHTQDEQIYLTETFMVMLPSLDKVNNDWIYDVVVSPKFTATPVPEDHSISLKVLKVWADTGAEANRPSEVTVQLLCNGEVYDTVTLNDANNWRHTWEELDDRFDWTVVEKELEDYSVRVVREGITFVVTNTYTGPTTPSQPDPPKPPSLPQTGQLWWPVPVLLACGLLLIVLGLIRRRGANYE